MNEKACRWKRNVRIENALPPWKRSFFSPVGSINTPLLSFLPYSNGNLAYREKYSLDEWKRKKRKKKRIDDAWSSLCCRIRREFTRGRWLFRGGGEMRFFSFSKENKKSRSMLYHSKRKKIHQSKGQNSKIRKWSSLLENWEAQGVLFSKKRKEKGKKEGETRSLLLLTLTSLCNFT